MLPLIALSLLASVMAQNLQCPTGVTNPNTFYIIGASGGDSTTACENTAAATTAGLTAGMNAVELDVSVSRDNVVFLWSDPMPTDPIAQARTQGLFVNGMCRPAFNTFLGSRDMVFSLIRQNFMYVNETGARQDATIPTLWEWMDAFAANTALQMIVLDLKIVDIDLSDFLVGHIMTKAVTLSVQNKIRIVSSDFNMAAAVQTSLSRAGYSINIAARSFGGTAGSLHLGSNADFDGVMEAETECYGMANIGQTVSSNGWRQYQNIIANMVITRDELITAGGNYIPVIGWRLNKIEKVAWMICAGVDGLYTDNIKEVKNLLDRRTAGDIACCMEDKVTPCLQPLDPRLLDQGCSSMGLSYYDFMTQSCPLWPLDILEAGTQLTCRQLKFCAVQ